MLTLYIKTDCSYCTNVRAVAEELGLTLEEKNIADETVADELVRLGGKRQVPYLVDSERHASLYESDAIVDYLREHYGANPMESEGETKPATEELL